MTDDTLTAGLLLQAYAAGIFPMAESRVDPNVFWVDPRERGILPLDGFHVSRSLARSMRSGVFTATLSHEFTSVVDGCAARDETWINPTIRGLYLELHEMGYAHSLEVWQDQKLVGGVYGVALGGAFFGESMFSSRKDASKTALTWLVDHLKRCGFLLFDTQFVTPHLISLGAVEIPRSTYQSQLAEAIQSQADIKALPLEQDAQAVVQRMTQTS